MMVWPILLDSKCKCIKDMVGFNSVDMVDLLEQAGYRYSNYLAGEPAPTICYAQWQGWWRWGN